MKQKQLIPFVSGLTTEQSTNWYSHLQLAMPDYEIKILTSENVSDFKTADVAIVANPDVGLLKLLPALKWVQSLWAGVEVLLAELPLDTLVCRMEDVELQKAMAEACLAWTLYLHRHMHLYQQQQERRVWLQHPVNAASETIVAVLGLGKLGLAACQRLQSNGFSVKGWSRSPKSVTGLDTFHGEEGLNQVLSNADIVIVLLPLTSETRLLINAKTIGMMKTGASLINFSRGGVIENSSLCQALQIGGLTHAVLDVFDVEPLPDDDPLWGIQNVTILPHISAPTNMVSASKIAGENVQRWLEQGKLPTMVDRLTGY